MHASVAVWAARLATMRAVAIRWPSAPSSTGDRGGVHRGPRHLEADRAVGEHVLDGLERADHPAELLALLRVLGAEVDRGGAQPDLERRAEQGGAGPQLVRRGPAASTARPAGQPTAAA